MKKYKHLFFDLDRTLWDFDYNTLDTFRDIFTKYHLKERGIPSLHDFMSTYKDHNTHLWDLYRSGLIEKEFLRIERFVLTLADFGIDDAILAEAIADDYIMLSPLKTQLFPHTKEILAYLKEKYHLHIITNGFEEVQISKVKVSGLEDFFESIITSEAAGFKKPHPNIFLYALEKSNALADCSLMIGDDLDIDVKGAKEAGIDQVFFNYDGISCHEPPTYEISSLKELMEIL